MGSTVALTDETFDATIASEKPTLVDFWAAWCRPCLAIAPALEELAAEQGDRCTIGKVDVEAYPQVAERFGVKGIPHLILFQEGAILAQLSGARGKQELEATLLPFL